MASRYSWTRNIHYRYAFHSIPSGQMHKLSTHLSAIVPSTKKCSTKSHCRRRYRRNLQKLRDHVAETQLINRWNRSPNLYSCHWCIAPKSSSSCVTKDGSNFLNGLLCVCVCKCVFVSRCFTHCTLARCVCFIKVYFICAKVYLRCLRDKVSVWNSNGGDTGRWYNHDADCALL